MEEIKLPFGLKKADNYQETQNKEDNKEIY